MIAMTFFYNHVIRYIDKLKFLLFYLNMKIDIREKSQKNEEGIPTKSLISQLPNAIE